MDFREICTSYCDVIYVDSIVEIFLAAVCGIDLNLEAMRGGRKFDVFQPEQAIWGLDQ